MNKLVVAMLREDANSRKILDAGCGTCGTTLELIKHGFDVTSTDSSFDMVVIGRQFLEANGCGSHGVIHTTIERYALEHSGAFDQIVSLDVIEHIEDHESALAALFNMLRPGGRLVLAVPAMPSLYGEKDIDLGHYRRYSKKMIVSLFKNQPCVLLHVRFWNLIGVPISWFYKNILHSKINESFRYSNSRKSSNIMNKILSSWFLYFENRFSPTVGLTLMVVAEKQ